MIQSIAIPLQAEAAVCARLTRRKIFIRMAAITTCSCWKLNLIGRAHLAEKWFPPVDALSHQIVTSLSECHLTLVINKTWLVFCAPFPRKELAGLNGGQYKHAHSRSIGKTIKFHSTWYGRRDLSSEFNEIGFSKFEPQRAGEQQQSARCRRKSSQETRTLSSAYLCDSYTRGGLWKAINLPSVP